tara:strand:+ start:719 stop:1339 length:621 start_codon:yes stop_codon:yes gene_type:complete
MYVPIGYNFLHTLPSRRLFETIVLKVKDQDVIDGTFVERGDRIFNHPVHGNIVEVSLQSRPPIRDHPMFRLLRDQNFPESTYRNAENTIVLIQYYEPNDLDSNQGFLFLQRGLVDLSNLRPLDTEEILPEELYEMGILTLETTNISDYQDEKHEAILNMGVVIDPDEFIMETRIAEELAFTMDPLMYRSISNDDFLERLPLSRRAL